jgi:hypothetical protein
MIITILIERAAAAFRAEEVQALNRAEACSSNSFFSSGVHEFWGFDTEQGLSPVDIIIEIQLPAKSDFQ